MKANELKKLLTDGALRAYTALYADPDAYCEKMDRIFGHGAAMKFRIRPLGATKLF